MRSNSALRTWCLATMLIPLSSLCCYYRNRQKPISEATFKSLYYVHRCDTVTAITFAQHVDYCLQQDRSLDLLGASVLIIETVALPRGVNNNLIIRTGLRQCSLPVTTIVKTANCKTSFLWHNYALKRLRSVHRHLTSHTKYHESAGEISTINSWD